MMAQISRFPEKNRMRVWGWNEYRLVIQLLLDDFWMDRYRLRPAQLALHVRQPPQEGSLILTEHLTCGQGSVEVDLLLVCLVADVIVTVLDSIESSLERVTL